MPTTTDSIAQVAAPAPIDSAMTVAADSVVVIPELKSNPMLGHNREIDAPTTVSMSSAYTTGTVPYSTGVEASPRPELPGTNSGVISILIVMFLIVTFSFKHFISVYRSLLQDLYMVRRRENAFDEHTAGESSTIMALNFQTAICQAILVYAAVNVVSPIPASASFPILAAFAGMMILFFIFQSLAFRLVAFAFAEPFYGSQWVRGLNATQALMGFLLLIPSIVVLFYPEATPTMLSIAAVIYVSMRIMLIVKGFRIFYDNFCSLIYFILYLCALEIVPLLILAAGAMSLSTFLQL